MCIANACRYIPFTTGKKVRAALAYNLFHLSYWYASYMAQALATLLPLPKTPDHGLDVYDAVSSILVLDVEED